MLGLYISLYLWKVIVNTIYLAMVKENSVLDLHGVEDSSMFPLQSGFSYSFTFLIKVDLNSNINISHLVEQFVFFIILHPLLLYYSPLHSPALSLASLLVQRGSPPQAERQSCHYAHFLWTQPVVYTHPGGPVIMQAGIIVLWWEL